MQTTKPNHTPQLLSAKSLGQLLSLSKRQVFRLRAAEKLPRPVKIGGSIRWVSEDIKKWISMGCPDRQSFEAMKGVKR